MSRPEPGLFTGSEKLLISAFVLVKFILIFQLPLTGDEAYFITWGQKLAFGYYDHPPVVGWAIYVLSFLSDSHYFYRFFAFTTSLAVATIMYKLLLQTSNRDIALYVAAIYLVSPASLISVVLTNDVVLVLFGMLGFYFLIKALESASWLLSVIAGVFFGLTFLSKYLSVLMFVGFILYLVLNPKKYNWKIALVVATTMLLFVFENVYFNMNNCWNNVVFNLYSRTKDSTFDISYLAVYLVFILALIPPYAIYRFPKTRMKPMPQYLSLSRYIALTFIIGLLIVSFYKSISLHWLVLGIPFIYLLFSYFSKTELRSLLKYNAIFSLIVGILFTVMSTFYTGLFSDHKRFSSILFYFETDKICDNFANDEIIFTKGYSASSVLNYHCKANEFHVIFDRSKFGREDDKNIDFSEYTGKTITLFSTERDELDFMSPYFDSVVSTPINAGHQITYFLATATNFNYLAYKKDFLQPVNNSFYNIPEWLPVSECRFKTKYGF